MNIIFGMFSNTARPNDFESATILRHASRSRARISSERTDVQFEVAFVARVVDEPVDRRDLVGRQLSEFSLEFRARLLALIRRQSRDDLFDDLAPLLVELGGRRIAFRCGCRVLRRARRVPPELRVLRASGRTTPSGQDRMSRILALWSSGGAVCLPAGAFSDPVASLLPFVIRRLRAVARTEFEIHCRVRAERGRQEKHDAQDQVHAERRRVIRAPPAQELDGQQRQA